MQHAGVLRYEPKHKYSTTAVSSEAAEQVADEKPPFNAHTEHIKRNKCA